MINLCYTCTFALSRCRGVPSASYPCLNCRNNPIFPLALKDCPNYYTDEEIPFNESRTEFARMVKNRNAIYERDKYNG